MTDEGESPLEQRVERLETGQQSILEKLDQLIGGKPATHQQAEQDMDKHLGRPNSVAEQVRAELARAEQEAAKNRADEDAKSQQETMAQRLAKLEEVKPDPPQPRRQVVMWGKR